MIFNITRFPRLSVHRPVTIAMFFIGVCIIGVVALVNLPVELMPNISFGQINITVQVRGGIPSSEIEERVARPIEEAVGSVSHIKNILSISKEGECTVILEFDPGIDMDFAALEVREKFARVKDKLPREIERPVIAQYGYGDMPIMIVAVTSDKYTPEELRNFVDDKIKERLSRAEGVAMIDVAGGRERKILIELDQASLASYGFSIEKVIDVLNVSNLNLLAGDITQDGSKYLVRAIGEFQSLDEIKQMIIMVTPQGGVVRVKDVADVKDSYLEPTSFARINVKPVVSLYIQKESLANTIRVSNAVEKEIRILSKELDKDVRITLTFNQADSVRKAVSQVNDSLIQGGILAIGVLFLFLRDISSIFIISVAIPVSIISIFSFMYLQKITLNVMTLSGLALATGMLVDNNIVVLENIFKRREDKPCKNREEFKHLVIDSTEEMALAITASTLTTVIVFLPLLFLNKEIQLLYGGLGNTVTYSLLVSLIVAITLVPMLASKVLKHTAPSQDSYEKIIDEEGVLIEVKQRRSFFKTVKSIFEAVLRFILTFRYVVIPVVIVLFVFSLRYANKLEREFMGVAEQNKFTIFVEMPTGTRLEISDKIVKAVENIVLTVPEVKSATARVEPWSSKIYVELKPLGQRVKSTRQIIEQLRPQVTVYEPAFIYFEEQEEVASKEVLLEIYGYDYDLLKDLAMKLGNIMQNAEKLTDIKIRMREGRPEMRILINKEKAAFFGWSVEEVSEVIHAQMRGLIPTRYHAKQDTYVRLKESPLFPEGGGIKPGLAQEKAISQQKKEEKNKFGLSKMMPASHESDEVEVIARLDERYRRTFDDLKKLVLMSKDGRPIYLSQMADLKLDMGPSEIWRKNKKRMVQVSANMGGQTLGAIAEKLTTAFKEVKFPENYYWRFGGNYEKMIQNQKELSLAFLLTLVLVYMVLAAMFESFSQPFIILATVPLATMGVVGVLYYLHKPIGVGVLVGVIMLAGIVVNNAIILVDSTNRLREEKKQGGLKHLIAESAGNRLRPILITTLTTVLGFVPMVLDKSESANLWSPLALTVMAGLTTSTFFTLFVIPCIYLVFIDIGKLTRFKRAK